MDKDDYDKGFDLGYADARAGRPRNPTARLLLRPFYRGYENGYITYLTTAYKYHHTECEAA